MEFSTSEEQDYNWWENNLEPESEEYQDTQDNIQDIQDTQTSQNIADFQDTQDIKGIQGTQSVVAANGTHTYQDTQDTRHLVFNDQLRRFVFTYIQVSVSSGCFQGVLVSVLKDFLVVVNNCLIIEIPFKEIEAIQFRAWGCPCKKTNLVPQKPNKNRSIKNSPIGFCVRDKTSDKSFAPELLRGLFADY